MTLCTNRTVIITGSGGGLGQAYAKALAKAGANVVINDIRSEAAQQTADEIIAQGGQALANNDDITTISGASKIIEAALSCFGEVHAVVNNAGICRDRMFINLTESDWDQVMSVHLKGHFCLAHLLAKRWRDAHKAGQNLQGRIINTSSGAGLLGSIGQSNYSAAKGGIASLTLVQAAELARYGITANCLAPAARTHMTESVFSDMMKKPEGDTFDFYDPANVAPLVVWLCSTKSQNITGQVFEVQGGQITLMEGWKHGPRQDKQQRWLPEELGEIIEKLIQSGSQPEKVYGS